MVPILKTSFKEPYEMNKYNSNENITFMWQMVFCWTQIATCNTNMVLPAGPIEFMTLFLNGPEEMTQFPQHLVHSNYYISFIDLNCHNFSWTSFDSNISLIAVSHFLFLFKDLLSFRIYWESTPEGERGRKIERERERDILNKLHTQHRAWCRAWSHDPGIVTWAEIKSQMFN